MELQPINGLSYYRLKQTDYNGDFSFNKTLSVHPYPENNMLSITIYSSSYNSINGSIVNPGNQQLYIYIFDGTGKNIYHSTLGNSNPCLFNIDTKYYKSGIYYLSIKGITSKINRKFWVE